MAVAGIAAVALAFTLLSAPALYVVAGVGLALIGLGLFASGYNNPFKNTHEKDSKPFGDANNPVEGAAP